MADIKVKFMHPTDGRVVDVDLDEDITAAEAIEELIAGEFIIVNPDGYNLAKKGGSQIWPDVSFAKAGIVSGDVIRIIPATSAGGSIVPGASTHVEKPIGSGIPGLRRTGKDSFTITDIQKSPEALIMIANMFEDLKLRYDSQARELEIERLRSNSRLTATLLLLVSQIVLSIGGNLLTQNVAVGIAILAAGSLQALLAVFLVFKKQDGAQR